MLDQESISINAGTCTSEAAVRESPENWERSSDLGRRTGYRRHRRGRLIVLLSCLAAGSLIVFQIQNPNLTARQGPRFVGQVAFSPDGKCLAWTSEGHGEGHVIVWDLDHNRQQLIIGPRQSEPEAVALSTYTTVAFSPDGRTIASLPAVGPAAAGHSGGRQPPSNPSRTSERTTRNKASHAAGLSAAEVLAVLTPIQEHLEGEGS
jgi:WD40 repeat protein